MKGANKRDVVADARAELLELGEAFDPWDGPIDYALGQTYNEQTKSSRPGSAMRWLEVAHDKGGDRVDREPAQLTLLEAHEALDRRIAQHDADGVWIARWQRLLDAADKAASEHDVDPGEATLGQLVGSEAIAAFLEAA